MNEKQNGLISNMRERRESVCMGARTKNIVLMIWLQQLYNFLVFYDIFVVSHFKKDYVIRKTNVVQFDSKRKSDPNTERQQRNNSAFFPMSRQSSFWMLFNLKIVLTSKNHLLLSSMQFDFHFHVCRFLSVEFWFLWNYLLFEASPYFLFANTHKD